MKKLNRNCLVFDICCVRMMAVTNEYRLVKIHRKKKLNQDNVGKKKTESLFFKKYSLLIRCSFNYNST